MSAVPALRIGDAERDAAAAALGEHYAAGRLTKDEYDERAERVWAARFGTDLEPLFADLPSPRGPQWSAGSPPPRGTGRARRTERRWPPILMPIVPVLAVALVAAVIIAGAPWLLFMLFWFWAIAGWGHRDARQRWRHENVSGPPNAWRR